MKRLIAISSLTLIVSCSHFEGRGSTPQKDQQIDLYCQRLNVLLHRMAATAHNIVNIQTTRTAEGGYYKRRIVSDCHQGVCKETRDETPPIQKYEPRHPDAVKGYVSYPNYTIESENADMKRWTMILDNVLASLPFKKDFFLNDPKAKMCFDKYSYVNENYNYKKYLGD